MDDGLMAGNIPFPQYFREEAILEMMICYVKGYGQKAKK